MIKNREKTTLVSAKELEHVICIQSPIVFPGGVTQDGLALDPILVLHNSSNEVNAMHPASVKKLGIVVQTTKLGAQKIDGTTFETYGMVVAAFSVTD